MTSVPLLYVGVAEPLVQAYCQWQVEIPQAGSPEERQAKLREFPKHQVGAYEIAVTEDHSKLEFQTAWHVNPKRVKHEIEKWSRGLPALVDERLDPVAGLDQEKLRTELKTALKGRPIRIEERIGLTLQQLQRDLSDQTPDLFLLICHGTREGCVLLEDGRGGSDVISGDRLFAVLRPLPTLVFLSACFSGAILKRAHWNDQGEQCAIVYIDAEHPVEVTAIARFGAEFIAGLLRGGSADVAFEAARRFLMNDTTVGDLSTSPGKTPPSQKFCLSMGGHAVKLTIAGQTSRVSSEPVQVESSAANSAARPGDPLLLSRRAAQFIGRQRELWQIIDALLPKPAGIRESPGATDKRLVTLTKEGGIGKTALALRAVDWIKARGLFPIGVLELSCEDLSSSTAFLAKLLDRFGVPEESRQDNVLASLAKHVSQLLGSGTALLVLDNLDDLVGKHAVTQSSHPATAARIIETLLGAAPDLHILTTCRWPLGLAAEMPLDIPPLDEGEACNLFVVYLEHPRHQAEVQATWKQVDSAARQLIRLSGCHPQSLCLLAKQMSRSSVTLTKLRDEAQKDLLKVLSDPLAADSDADRLKKVENSYELSYRHLSDPAKHLFQHLAFLPGGVWCGTIPEHFLNWGELLGDHWRNLLESELKYFALMDFVSNSDSHGTFRMSPPMLEFARKKYGQHLDPGWEQRWIKFWREHLASWDTALSGKVPEDTVDGDRAWIGKASQLAQLAAKLLFEHTAINWQRVFSHCEYHQPRLVRELLLNLTSYTQLSGNRLLGRELAERAVACVRPLGSDEDLAPCLVTLGNALRDLGERQAAREQYEKALAIYRRLAQAHPAAFEPGVAMTLNNLGTVLSDLGERQAAHEQFEEALAIRRRLAQAHPAAFEPGVAMTLNNLGNVLRELGERQAAREQFEEALAIRHRLAQAHPAAFEPDVAMTLSNLGTVLRELGERQAAREQLEEALEIYHRYMERFPQAFSHNFEGVLRSYKRLIEEDQQRPSAGGLEKLMKWVKGKLTRWLH